VHWVVKGLEQRPEVELDLPERLVVFGNAGQLHQVLVNLVQNAVDATAGHPRPVIRIDATSGSGHAWLRVRDNGPGLAERDLPHIFEPFYTTKDPGQGTGLGLWICYEIVEHHGGTLEATNRPDGGALFTLTLPLSG
jgi:two-component system sensor histidine kinase HupT/HoxJ